MRFVRQVKIVFKKLRKFFRNKINKLEIFIADILYDRRDSFSVKCLQIFFKILSVIFLFIVKIRFWLYYGGVWRRHHLGCPVVVVGNITMGGTGKTPVVEKLAKELQCQGRKVAILSRGYKSRPEKKYKLLLRWLIHADEVPPKVVSDGKKILLNSYIAGDEPYMLAKNLPGVVVIVDKDRVKAGYYAIKNFNVDTIILDDGFQYLPLAGHLNLLLIDTTNPFGNSNVLPRGILREPIDHIKRASYILLTKSTGNDETALVGVIRKYNKQAKLIYCRHKPMYLQSFDYSTMLPIEELSGKRIAIFSGIASPEGFERFLTSNGVQIVFNCRFIDHHRFTKEEIKYIYSSAVQNNADIIVTTEKDIVRINQDLVSEVPLFFLKIEIEILRGNDVLEEAVNRLRK